MILVFIVKKIEIIGIPMTIIVARTPMIDNPDDDEREMPNNVRVTSRSRVYPPPSCVTTIYTLHFTRPPKFTETLVFVVFVFSSYTNVKHETDPLFIYLLFLPPLQQVVT